SAASTRVAVRRRTFKVRSDSSLSCSNSAPISGSAHRRPLSASRLMKRPKSESTLSACGRNNEASSPALRRGLPSRPTTRGSAATCAAKASFSAQAAKVPFDTAVSKAARAYGRARVSALDMGSDLAHELVEQILVRIGIDLAL